MYSGTGVCAGQAHWQSTTLWKYAGFVTSVVCKTQPLPILRARFFGSSSWRRAAGSGRRPYGIYPWAGLYAIFRPEPVGPWARADGQGKTMRILLLLALLLLPAATRAADLKLATWN